MYQFLKTSSIHLYAKQSVARHDMFMYDLPRNLYELVIWLQPTFDYLAHYDSHRPSFSIYETQKYINFNLININTKSDNNNNSSTNNMKIEHEFSESGLKLLPLNNINSVKIRDYSIILCRKYIKQIQKYRLYEILQSNIDISEYLPIGISIFILSEIIEFELGNIDIILFTLNFLRNEVHSITMYSIIGYLFGMFLILI